jgi:hypothetical protein
VQPLTTIRSIGIPILLLHFNDSNYLTFKAFPSTISAIDFWLQVLKHSVESRMLGFIAIDQINPRDIRRS